MAQGSSLNGGLVADMRSLVPRKCKNCSQHYGCRKSGSQFFASTFMDFVLQRIYNVICIGGCRERPAAIPLVSAKVLLRVPFLKCT